MLSSKYFLAVLLVAASFMTGFHTAHYFNPAPAIAEQTIDKAPSEEALKLCERLTRFGSTAYARGQFVEAKNFFQKAITVYPANASAWKHYNMSLLSLISAKVETDPAFLPEPSANTVHAPAQDSESRSQTEKPDDGC